MTETRRIVWMASYPKSGNTWMRVLFNHVLFPGSAVSNSDINSLRLVDHAAGRWLLEAVSACPTSELTDDEVELLRPCAYRALASRKTGPILVKVHDAYRRLGPAAPLFPEQISRCVVYLLRNPMDVAVSFAAQLGIDIDRTIDLMAEEFCLSGGANGISGQIRQSLGSWSEHVRSWTSQRAIPVEVVRYEDLFADTAGCLWRAAHAAAIELGMNTVSEAVAAAAFERLQTMEMESGFREKPSSQRGLFFRSGRVGGWRDRLSARQVDRLVAAHEPMMTEFGYMDLL